MPIFVSYSRLDEQVVKALVQGLEAARRDVWFDNDLGGGEVWWVKILESIRQAEVVVFALSDNALQSKPCRAELDYALALDRTVLPIMVGPVANFRSNPLSALQTIEFRQEDSMSGFAIVAAVEAAAKRLRPLPDPLPPLPPIPFAYLVSLDKQIDNEVLSPQAQIDAVDELRKAFREETDPSVHADILATLRKLAGKPWATVQAANEVEAVIAWTEGHRQPKLTARAEPGTAGNAPLEEDGPSAAEVEEAERESRAKFEANVAEKVGEQEKERVTAATDGDAPSTAPRPEPAAAAPAAPRSTPTAAHAEQVAQIRRFEGVSRPLAPPRAAAGAAQPLPGYFTQPPAQPRPLATGHGYAQQPPGHSTPGRQLPPPRPAPFPVGPQPRPHWGWAVAGLLPPVLFGLIALYFCAQVRTRWESGDQAGADRASGKARRWGVVGLVVGVLVILQRLL